MVPERAAGVERLQIVQEGEWLGVLDVDLNPTPSQKEVLQVTADLLAPFFGSLELAEDLASRWRSGRGRSRSSGGSPAW